MDLRQFTDLGGDIGRRVTDAINTGDYSQLSRDIRRTIEQAFTGSAYDGGLDGKLYKGPEPVKNAGFDRVEPVKPKGQSEAMVNTAGLVPVTSKPPKKTGPVIMMIAGYAMAGIFGFSAIALALMMIPAAALDEFAVGLFGASAGLMVPFTAGGLVLGIAGTKKYGAANRFRTYCSTLAGNSFCQISKLAESIRKKESYTAKDLQKMIDKGYFPEGHIDDHKTCFIGTDETYKQYQMAKESAEKAKIRAAEEAQGIRSMPEDLQQVITEGEAYIKTIREANDAIYDAVISEKLFRMEIIVKKIFEYVKENPDQIGQLRRFMSYYMPTTEKLVKAYQQMDEETVLGKNMTKAKDEIAETLDTINDAYEKLYDDMYVDVAVDVTSDIAVLKTMFAREGLTKDELNGGN